MACCTATGLVQQLMVAQEAEAIGGNPMDYKKVRLPAGQFQQLQKLQPQEDTYY
jgi:hypothetical protein